MKDFFSKVLGFLKAQHERQVEREERRKARQQKLALVGIIVVGVLILVVLVITTFAGDRTRPNSGVHATFILRIHPDAEVDQARYKEWVQNVAKLTPYKSASFKIDRKNTALPTSTDAKTAVSQWTDILWTDEARYDQLFYKHNKIFVAVIPNLNSEGVAEISLPIVVMNAKAEWWVLAHEVAHTLGIGIEADDPNCTHYEEDGAVHYPLMGYCHKSYDRRLTNARWATAYETLTGKKIK